MRVTAPLALLAIAFPAHAQKAAAEPPAPPASRVAFERDPERGSARARTEGRPVFLAVLGKGAADVAVQVRTLDDPELAVRSRELVCIAADPERHPAYEIEDKSGPVVVTRRACHRYRWIDCAAHQRAYELARKRFPELVAARPSLTFLSPDTVETTSRWGPTATSRRLASECLLALRASGRRDDPAFASDRKLFKKLRKQLRDDKRFHRREALRQVARIPLAEARSFLFGLLDTKVRARTRVLVCDAHGMRGSVDARKAIERGIDRELGGRKNVAVLEAGISAIGRVELADSVPYLLGIQKRLGSRVPANAFANALALCGRGDPRVHAWFAKAYAASDAARSRAAFNATAALEPSASLLRALRAQLDSADEERRTAASRLLAALEQRR